MAGTPCTHVPEVTSLAQHRKWLFDEGVLRWNQHRRDRFKPNFAGLNF
jgi:hypothetical protein